MVILWFTTASQANQQIFSNIFDTSHDIFFIRTLLAWQEPVMIGCKAMIETTGLQANVIPRTATNMAAETT